MAKAQKKVSKIKIKKKRWFPIFAPKFLGQKEIGESYLVEAQNAVGRMMRVNLRDLTGSIRDQNIYVSLKISEAVGSNLQTDVVGYAYMPFFIKKLSRKNTGVVTDSFLLKTKEGKIARLKPLTVTVFKTNKSVQTMIRKRVRELLEEEVSKTNFDALINDLLKYKLQMEFKKRLNKICPVREVVMRVVKLEEGKKARAQVKEVKKPVEEKKAEVQEEPKEEKKEVLKEEGREVEEK